MAKLNLTSYVSDELANKVKCLTIALNQANSIINSLETENKRLQDVLSALTSLNTKEHDISNETMCV